MPTGIDLPPVQTLALRPDPSSCPGCRVFVVDEGAEYRSTGTDWVDGAAKNLRPLVLDALPVDSAHPTATFAYRRFFGNTAIDGPLTAKSNYRGSYGRSCALAFDVGEGFAVQQSSLNDANETFVQTIIYPDGSTVDDLLTAVTNGDIFIEGISLSLTEGPLAGGDGGEALLVPLPDPCGLVLGGADYTLSPNDPTTIIAGYNSESYSIAVQLPPDFTGLAYHFCAPGEMGSGSIAGWCILAGLQANEGDTPDYIPIGVGLQEDPALLDNVDGPDLWASSASLVAGNGLSSPLLGMVTLNPVTPDPVTPDPVTPDQILVINNQVAAGATRAFTDFYFPGYPIRVTASLAGSEGRKFSVEFAEGVTDPLNDYEFEFVGAVLDGVFKVKFAAGKELVFDTFISAANASIAWGHIEFSSGPAQRSYTGDVFPRGAAFQLSAKSPQRLNHGGVDCIMSLSSPRKVLARPLSTSSMVTVQIPPAEGSVPWWIQIMPTNSARVLVVNDEGVPINGGGLIGDEEAATQNITNVSWDGDYLSIDNS